MAFVNAGAADGTLTSPTPVGDSVESMRCTSIEGTERIRCVRLPFEEAMGMLAEGRITHGPTCVLMLKVHALFSVRGAPGER